jgi:3',5'-cyclic AMP phosphodiesterase CpdA
MTETFTLANFSDVHLSPIPGFDWRYFNVKRVLGYLNWQRSRRHVHRRTVADRLIADALALRSDHIVITGDLVNLGLPAEHEAALTWLQSVGPPDQVTVIPGNHDIYSSMRGDSGVARWAEYMGCEEDTLAFPFVRRVGPLALVGLNSAV